MTDKTIEELAEEYLNTDYAKSYHDPKDAFCAGYQAALQPKWTKLPELPTKFTDYDVTIRNAGTKERVVSRDYFGADNRWQHFDSVIAGSWHIIAWAEIIKPQPFTESEDKL